MQKGRQQNDSLANGLGGADWVNSTSLAVSLEVPRPGTPNQHTPPSSVSLPPPCPALPAHCPPAPLPSAPFLLFCPRLPPILPSLSSLPPCPYSLPAWCFVGAYVLTSSAG